MHTATTSGLHHNFSFLGKPIDIISWVSLIDLCAYIHKLWTSLFTTCSRSNNSQRLLCSTLARLGQHFPARAVSATASPLAATRLLAVRQQPSVFSSTAKSNNSIQIFHASHPPLHIVSPFTSKRYFEDSSTETYPRQPGNHILWVKPWRMFC